MRVIFTWLSNRFELDRGEKGQNLPPMEGVRGFAVFLVFLAHFASLIAPGIRDVSGLGVMTDTLHRVGNVGVDLFFVLSGYLIYGSLISRPQKFFHFISRRIVRIYPAFLVVFCLYIALSFAFPAENKIPPSLGGGVAYLLENILLLPGLFPIEPMITVAWSLSYEFFYYLIIPVVIAVFSMQSPPPPRSVGLRISLFLVFACAFTCLCALYGGPVRLIMFIAGIVLFDVLRTFATSARHDWMGLTAISVAIFSHLLPIEGNLGDAVKTVLVFGACFIFCFVLFSKADGWLKNSFSWLPLRWLGNMSYSYY